MIDVQVAIKRSVSNKTCNEKSPLAGLLIYMAEDEYINQRMISSFLKEKGALVKLCENGLELLLALEKSWPDVILMDVRMPIMDGLEAVREIRKCERYLGRGRVPIIALSAHGVQDHDVICLTAGMDEYLSKPVDPDRLASAILSLCRRGPYG